MHAHSFPLAACPLRFKLQCETHGSADTALAARKLERALALEEGKASGGTEKQRRRRKRCRNFAAGGPGVHLLGDEDDGGGYPASSAGHDIADTAGGELHNAEQHGMAVPQARLKRACVREGREGEASDGELKGRSPDSRLAVVESEAVHGLPSLETQQGDSRLAVVESGDCNSS